MGSGNISFNPEIYRRRSIRLQGYNYAKSGAYFVTICSQNQACLFGKIVNGKMVLNSVGKMLRIIWTELPTYYAKTKIDHFIIMPNHIHGIIMIDELRATNNITVLSLPDLVHRFKSLTTKRYIDGVKLKKWRPFITRLWQRNYWERIIRNKWELNRIRKYIINNPSKWDLDTLNKNKIMVGATPCGRP